MVNISKVHSCQCCDGNEVPPPCEDGSGPSGDLHVFVGTQPCVGFTLEWEASAGSIAWLRRVFCVAPEAGCKPDFSDAAMWESRMMYTSAFSTPSLAYAGSYVCVCWAVSHLGGVGITIPLTCPVVSNAASYFSWFSEIRSEVADAGKGAGCLQGRSPALCFCKDAQDVCVCESKCLYLTDSGGKTVLFSFPVQDFFFLSVSQQTRNFSPRFTASLQLFFKEFYFPPTWMLKSFLFRLSCVIHPSVWAHWCLWCLAAPLSGTPCRGW